MRVSDPRGRAKNRNQAGKSLRRKRYHHGDLPRALLDAALHIVEKRTEALTLRAVARLAGVSQAAPYRHFASKEAILAAVAEDGFRSLMAAMQESLDACGEGPLGRLRAVGLGYVTFATSHPSHFRLMFGRERRTLDLPSLRQVATDRSASSSRRSDCQRAGPARSEEPAANPALTAWSCVHGLPALLVDGCSTSRRRASRDGNAGSVLGLGAPG
jgi:AcrR family transcriptional regulator